MVNNQRVSIDTKGKDIKSALMESIADNISSDAGEYVRENFTHNNLSKEEKEKEITDELAFLKKSMEELHNRSESEKIYYKIRHNRDVLLMNVGLFIGIIGIILAVLFWLRII